MVDVVQDESLPEVEDAFERTRDQVFDAIKQHENEDPLDFSFILPLEDGDVAQLIESVPPEYRLWLWRSIPSDRYWPVLHQLQLDTAKHVIDDLHVFDLDVLQDLASPQDLLALADVLPDTMVSAILADQDESVVDDLQEALNYDDEQIGRYLNKNIMKVRYSRTVGVVKRRLGKRQDGLPVAIFVIDEKGELLGHVPLAMIFTSQDGISMESLCIELSGLDHQATFSDAIRETQSTDDTAWYPVLRSDKVVGAISASSILWSVQDAFVLASSHEAPSDEEDLFAPIGVAARMRAIWLTINLATAFLASWVIGLFEVTLQEVVALAILMPIVASMGGIAGSQTLAIALRGIALNHLTDANIYLLFSKESRIAIINGTAIGLVIGLVVGSVFESVGLGAIIFIAIVVNSFAAASSGTFIPMVLKKLKIDPAISGAVILTTVTDIVGYFIFLGLGSLVLTSG